jgi:hypothetical protein
MATTVVHVLDTSPLGNMLHLVLFVAGSAIIGLVALLLLERLAGGDERQRFGLRHVAVPVVVFLAALGGEVLFHALGGH